MIGIDTYIVEFKIEWVSAYWQMLEFIFVQVRPPPQSGIDDVREALAACHLQTTVECPRYCNTLSRHGAFLLHASHECVHLVRFVLELLGKTFDGALSKLLIVGALQMTHEAVHNTGPRFVRGEACRGGAARLRHWRLHAGC